jgi:hypothetical protein
MYVCFVAPYVSHAHDDATQSVVLKVSMYVCFHWTQVLHLYRVTRSSPKICPSEAEIVLQNDNAKTFVLPSMQLLHISNTTFASLYLWDNSIHYPNNNAHVHMQTAFNHVYPK